MKAGGPEDIDRYLREEEPPRELTGLEKKIRAWAENLIERDQKTLEAENSRSLTNFGENRYRLHHLKKEFERVSDPGFEGTAAAIKLICRHYFDRIPQPF